MEMRGRCTRGKGVDLDVNHSPRTNGCLALAKSSSIALFKVSPRNAKLSVASTWIARNCKPRTSAALAPKE